VTYFTVGAELGDGGRASGSTAIGGNKNKRQ